MTTPADIIADTLAKTAPLRRPYTERAEGVIAALDAAGYQIAPKAERPSVCPTCRSHNPRIAGHWNGYLTRPCPDPWHGGTE